MLNFSRLQTPSGDGDVLIEPAAAAWPQLIENNLGRAGQDGLALAGVPVDEVRRVTRDRLLTASADQTVIACGHQPAFVHPGVWAKQVVVHHAAGHLGGQGVDLVVDNDAPGSSALRIPAVDGEGFVLTRDVAFTDAPAGTAYEARLPLAPGKIASIRAELRDALPACLGSSMIGSYLDGAGRCSAPRDAVEQHLSGRAAVDAPLSADLREVRVSDAFGGSFLADVLLNAERFAEAYNASLRAYRAEQGVRGADRPLPDLGRRGERMETPLWVYQPGHPRRRLWVTCDGDAVDCHADQELLGTLAARDLTSDPDATLESLRPWVIRPRALTLTLWARLLACDLFVHGIGGAKYDRITDGIFRRYYRCEPPAYACVTATLRLGLPRYGASEGDLRAARRRLRDLAYNPQRYVTGADRELLAERGRLIHESQRLRAERAPRAGRKDVFHGIRRVNARLVESSPDVGRELAGSLQRIERQAASDAAADTREYFYALQPRARLATLARTLVEQAGLPE